MGVQPIRGVGMVRLRLRVSGARANHLCGRRRADTRACCERGARALQSKTCSGGNPADDWKAGNIAPGVRQKLVGARVMPPCPRRGAPSRRDAPNAGAAREPPTCSFPSDLVFGACSATRPTWPRLPPGRIFPRPWEAPRANRFANTSTAPYVLGSQTGGSSWDGSCALISRETSS